MCREPCTKLGMNWEERILRLHLTVHAVVHTKHFINKHNVKCKPYGPWGHFLGQCTLKLITLSLRRLRCACGAQEAFPMAMLYKFVTVAREMAMRDCEVRCPLHAFHAMQSTVCTRRAVQLSRTWSCLALA